MDVFDASDSQTGMVDPRDRSALERAVVDLLGERLQEAGWRRRRGEYGSILFTQPVGSVEVVTVRPFPIWSAEDDRLLTVVLQLGLGLEPALGVSAELPGIFLPALARAPYSDGASQSASLRDERQVDSVVDQLSAKVAQHLAWAIDISDYASVFRNAVNAASNGEPLHSARLRFLVEAGYGRYDEARAALLTVDPETLGLTERRFLLQALAWLGGDPPIAPPLQDVVTNPPPRASWGSILTNAMKTTDAKRDARLRLERYRRSHTNADATSLRVHLAADYAEHGVIASPIDVAAAVDRILNAHWLRGQIQVAQALGQGIGLVTRLARERRWPRQSSALERPERASYTTYKAARDHWALIDISAETSAWLDKHLAEGETQVAKAAAVYVWLQRTPGNPNSITALIGERPVGELDQVARGAWQAVVDLASISDEQVAILATYLHVTPPVLQLPLPV